MATCSQQMVMANMHKRHVMSQSTDESIQHTGRLRENYKVTRQTAIALQKTRNELGVTVQAGNMTGSHLAVS